MLQFISHYTEQYSYLDSIRIALQGGCRWIQLRMKDASDDEVRPIATEALQMCRDVGATFIIDDRVELVREIRADGVHLGKNDMPIAQARKVLGDSFIIGGTANTFDDVRAHYEASANYIGCGPGYRHIVNQMAKANIHIPIVAIGGITAEDIPTIMQTGISGIALSSTILRAAHPIEEMKRIISITKS